MSNAETPRARGSSRTGPIEFLALGFEDLDDTGRIAGVDTAP